jgi:dephospho-CoA kinase
MIIGLTGGIASGKSTVSLMLAEKGAVIIDADQVSREIVQPGKPAWQEIVDWQGRAILLADGTIDRKRLGRLIFRNKEARLKLNRIIHFRVKEEMAARAEAALKGSPEAVLVYDVPLLFEAGMHNLVDLIVLVYVSPDMQIIRLQQRDKLSRKDALLRIRAQMPLEEKKKYAHTVIDNSASLQDTACQVDHFWEMAVQGKKV